jgi:hypothetical protein
MLQFAKMCPEQWFAERTTIMFFVGTTTITIDTV